MNPKNRTLEGKNWTLGGSQKKSDIIYGCSLSKSSKSKEFVKIIDSFSVFTCRLGIRETLGQSPLKNVDVLQTLFFFRYIIRWWVKGKPHISFQGHCCWIGYYFSTYTSVFSQNMYDKFIVIVLYTLHKCHENWISRDRGHWK